MKLNLMKLQCSNFHPGASHATFVQFKITA